MKDELIKTWRKDGFTLRRYDTHETDSLGKCRLAYQFKDGRKTIFAGNDFHCSPLHAIDSLATVYSLLGFLSVGEHDTDAEYFNNYTLEQIAWRDSVRRDYLSLLVCDAEERLSKR